MNAALESTGAHAVVLKVYRMHEKRRSYAHRHQMQATTTTARSYWADQVVKANEAMAIVRSVIVALDNEGYQ